MSDVSVTVVGEPDPAEEVAEEVAEAIEDVQDSNKDMLLGALVARVETLEQRCQYHDDLINLHSHDGFPERADLIEVEERICSKIDSITPVEEIPEEPIIEEPAPEPESEETKDEPPKSRRNRKSVADMYYGR